MAAYQAALGSRPELIGVANRSKPGSVSAAIVSYYGSQSFRNLTGGTPAMRRAILERFRGQHGDKPIALMPKKFIVALLDQMEPFAARNWLKAIRALMHHCVEHELIRENPTQGIKLPTIKSHGHHTWTEDEIAAFEAHHPIGSKALLAFALLLYTAQRRGDVIRMGRQHVRDGVLRLRQQKTGATLAIPVSPALQAAIDAMPGDHLTLLVTKSGKTYAPPTSPSNSASGATTPVCRGAAPRMGCARPHVVGWPKLAVAPTRLPPSADMRRCARSSATPGPPIRRAWRRARWQRRLRGNKRGRIVSKSSGIDCQSH